ncbi:SnoaL-like domain-containing protein [Asanoa hainanensis]|uniref:SnoaL-like domain-containing protein n=1 Tax=Asanoa hainanensis TaxID=560556 RepID=A0A239P9U0_9ACTN|nr:nuclear transport factor 2 family protein [Asanoa hainanensis]SNT63896.1 SnoaL-like domain-containing protein [Asanoa hainanensis]
MSEERQVQQVLARYVRAVDWRDGAAMSALFVTDAKAEIFYNRAGEPEKVGELVGAEAIGAAIAGLMKPHPPRGWSHHTTHDHLIEVEGDDATIDAQFVVFNTVGDVRPADGWPEGVRGPQGTVTPIESGYYRPTMRRVDGRWMITHHRIVLDQPMAFPNTP